MLPPYITSFQAELTALLLALRHASEGYVGDVPLHYDSPKDNIQLLSSIHLAVLYRSGTAVTCHWVPGHVGVSGNERADTAARLAGAGPRVIFTILRSASSIKTPVNRAAMKATRSLFNTPVEASGRHPGTPRQFNENHFSFRPTWLLLLPHMSIAYVLSNCVRRRYARQNQNPAHTACWRRKTLFTTTCSVVQRHTSSPPVWPDIVSRAKLGNYLIKLYLLGSVRLCYVRLG